MKTTFAALTLAAALAQPAAAVTFPSLTTIYVSTGIRDDANLSGMGIATVFHCINVSGVTASIRYVVLNFNGSVINSITRTALHGATITASTHATNLFDNELDNQIIPGLGVAQGGLNIELTQSGVFCTGMIVDVAATVSQGIDLHLVRVNPHPGTVE